VLQYLSHQILWHIGHIKSWHMHGLLNVDERKTNYTV
jgi:hypothetical protein